MSDLLTWTSYNYGGGNLAWKIETPNQQGVCVYQLNKNIYQGHIYGDKDFMSTDRIPKTTSFVEALKSAEQLYNDHFFWDK